MVGRREEREGGRMNDRRNELERENGGWKEMRKKARGNGVHRRGVCECVDRIRREVRRRH